MNITVYVQRNIIITECKYLHISVTLHGLKKPEVAAPHIQSTYKLHASYCCTIAELKVGQA